MGFKLVCIFIVGIMDEVDDYLIWEMVQVLQAECCWQWIDVYNF